jgi:hypothetical protein
MESLQKEIGSLLREEDETKNGLLTVFKELGYEIKL